MNQVITQHGWGLDQSFWDNYKVEFQKNGWHWQDNERGYFSKNVIQSKWIKSDLNNHCLLYTSPSPRDRTRSRMPSSA